MTENQPGSRLHQYQKHIRRSLGTAKLMAVLVLIEQGYEVLVQGISLAENPIVVIAALGALGFPIPGGKDQQ